MASEIKLITLVNWENQTHDDFGTSIRPQAGENWRECYQRLHEKIYSSPGDALQQASFYNCEKVIHKLVIKEGRDVNGKDSQQMISLALAIDGRAIESVRMLLRLQADVNQICFRLIPLQYVGRVNDSNIEIAQLLIGKMTQIKFEIWENAARNGDFNLLTLLAERNFDVNVQNSRGETVLHCLVCDDNKLRMIKWFIAHGISVNIPDLNGVTALHHAMRRRDIGCIEALLDAGADMFAVDKNGDGCIAWGLFEDSPEAAWSECKQMLVFQSLMLGLKFAPTLIFLYKKYLTLKNLFHFNK
jgi:hypothetical protein